MVVGSPEGSRPGKTAGTTTGIGDRLASLDIGIAEVHDAAIASTMRTLAVESPPRQQSQPQPAGSEAEMTGQEVVVELRGIRKSFGTNEVLHGVDLTVQAGQHVVIFGPSGSGKSTVLRTINLLEEPSEGSVRVLGVEYGPGIPGEPRVKRGSALELRRQVGMVFQQFNLFPHLTALDNIALALRTVQKLGRTEAEERAANGLRQVGLLRWAARYPTQLSGGQQQRVAIARALSLDPAVMLFDEPTSALDPELEGDVLGVIR
jgi:ABC-type polar amino acid transport system ATPase subunit